MRASGSSSSGHSPRPPPSLFQYAAAPTFTAPRAGRRMLGLQVYRRSSREAYLLMYAQPFCRS